MSNTGELHPVLRPIRVDDAEAVHEIRQQPLVVRFTSALPYEPLTSARQFLERLGPQDRLLVAVVDGRVVALAGLHGRDGKQRHSASVGLAVHDAFAGRGVGRALLTALLELADNALGLRRVDLDVFADNERAIRLYEGFGFEREGYRKMAYFRAGQFADAIEMARLR